MKYSFYESSSAYKRVFVFFRCLLPFVGIVLAAGCSGDVASEIIPVTLQPPEVFEFNRVKWRREDSLGQSDTRLLSRFFKMNPSMIDSPVLEGTPTVYHGTRNRRRFYWVSGTATQPLWLCVQYKKGAFQLLEGHGSPYGNRSD